MKISVLAICLLAGACTAPPASFDKELAGPAPTNYKATIAAYIKRTYFDPYSLRDVKISTPSQGRVTITQGVLRIPVSDQQGWFVCVELNAKNRMGGYVGLTDKGFLLRNETIIDDDVECPADTLTTLQPWPELEGK